ncbi:hypothetical protein [Mycoavidus sp. SF9855]|uniref:hypothetical protein n=1 Tax=Mycoavidus sp. SF9855 TaxID=2968475 RepID=UPI00211C9C87|nr:hypothetical protein [Mycoavidus sp. SF9855]UUM21135.1 hypothetical protein NQD60_06685 [Mycoavidus sp. SF9855]
MGFSLSAARRLNPLVCRLDWTGLDWTGLDWTGLDWTGLDWTGLDWTASNDHAVHLIAPV